MNDHENNHEFSYILSVLIDVKKCQRKVSIFIYLPSVGFPGGSGGEESSCNAGDPGLTPALRRSPGQGSGYTL